MKPIIRVGLEVHTQLTSLKTKLFCNCSTDYRNKEPNVNTCPICKGLPGTLPNVNADAIKKGILLARALNMAIPNFLSFNRKHYDYPDLPKGFQITQTDGAVGKDGFLPLKNKNVRIRQIQIEEDPAKLKYVSNTETIVDYNRSGIALIELVTEPVLHQADEIKEFLTIYRRLIFYLDIADTHIEGALRVDLNISVNDHPRVEIKNIGSDTEILNAFYYEIERQQIDLKSDGMETRHWDPELKQTVLSRSKESAPDYHYMIEGNIPTIKLSELSPEMIILPELPWEKEKKLLQRYSLTTAEINILLDDKFLLNLYEKLHAIEKVSLSFKNEFFWRDFLSYYHNENENVVKQAMKIVDDITSLENLFISREHEEITIIQYRKCIRDYFTKNKPLYIENLINNKTNDLSKILEQLKKQFPEIWTSSFQNPNQLNYLVGIGVKLSKGTIKPHLLLETLKKRKQE